MRYVALLRGINVGGNSLIRMADLKLALSAAGFDNVLTYIQSGNVLFDSDNKDKLALARQLETTIEKTFKLNVAVVVFSASQWVKIIKSAPTWWGRDPEWKHNLLVLLPPTGASEALEAMGTLKPDIEEAKSGDGVIYQSMSFKLFGRTTAGKLAANPIYKKMTIRNYNTANKLAALMTNS